MLVSTLQNSALSAYLDFLGSEWQLLGTSSTVRSPVYTENIRQLKMKSWGTPRVVWNKSLVWLFIRFLEFKSYSFKKLE